MKVKSLIVLIILVCLLGGGILVYKNIFQAKEREIILTGPKELKAVISPSVGNTLSGDIVIKLETFPKETGFIAFALVPSKEQFDFNSHVVGMDIDAKNGWDFELDTLTFENGTYNLAIFSLKEPGQPPLEIASTKVIIKNKETMGFVPPPSNEINYQKSLLLSEYTATKSDIKRAKELGANMVTLAFNIDTSNNQVKIPFDPTENFQKLKRKLSSLINEAHRQGLQVELRTIMSPQSTGATDIEKFLSNLIPFMADWAKFAQDHQIYSFTTFGEVDNNWFLKKVDPETIERINKEVLAEVKKNYKGKVGVGFCCTYSKFYGLEGKEYQYDLTGYDYIAISIYPGGGEGEEVLKRYFSVLELIISSAKNMANKSGIDKVIIGEVGVATFSTQFKIPVVSEEKEAEFYDKLFTATNKIVNGYSILYSFPMASIKGKPAEEVIKEWYQKIP